MYYYYHRWYDPSIGRFISPDPKQGKLSNPQSLNLYSYVLDRPTSLVDPSGLDGCGFWDVGCHVNSFTNTVVGGATTLYNGAVSFGNGVVNEWNNDPNFRTMVISVAVIAVVAVATGGLGLAVTPVLIGGLSGAGISGLFYGATCSGSKGGCSAEGFGAAVLSGGALGALGGVAGPIAGSFSVEEVTGASALAAPSSRGIAGAIDAVGQASIDIAGGKSSAQTLADASIAFGFGAASGTSLPSDADLYGFKSLAYQISTYQMPRDVLAMSLRSSGIQGLADTLFIY